MPPESIRMHPTVSVCAIAISAWVMWGLQTSNPGPIIVGLLSGWLQGLIGAYCVLATIKMEPLFVRLSKLGCVVVYVGFFEFTAVLMFADFPRHYDRFPVVGRAMELAVVPALFTSAMVLAGFDNTKRIGDLLNATLLAALGFVAINLSGSSNPMPDLQILMFWCSTVSVTAFSMCVFAWHFYSKTNLIASATMLCSSIAFVILIAENVLAIMRILACFVQLCVIGLIMWQNSCVDGGASRERKKVSGSSNSRRWDSIQ